MSPTLISCPRCPGSPLSSRRCTSLLPSPAWRHTVIVSISLLNREHTTLHTSITHITITHLYMSHYYLLHINTSERAARIKLKQRVVFYSPKGQKTVCPCSEPSLLIISIVQSYEGKFFLSRQVSHYLFQLVLLETSLSNLYIFSSI